MITVNVWDPTGGAFGGISGGRFGHASLEIGATAYAPAVTVSWWPHGFILYSLAGDDAVVLPYDDELVQEDHEVPDHRYRLPGNQDNAAGVSGTRAHIGLDESAMRQWWTEWQSDRTYRLFDRNCCSTVIRCLMAGASGYAELGGVEVLADNWIARPSDVRLLCEAIITGMAAARY